MNRGYIVPHTPGGLQELSSNPPPTIVSCTFPHVVEGRGRSLQQREEKLESGEDGLREGEWPPQATSPEPPSPYPSPALSSTTTPPVPYFQLLEEFPSSLSTRKARNLGVSCFPLTITPTASVWGAFLQWGRGPWPHPLGILPTAGGLAGVGASSQAVTQLAEYSCCGQF